MKLHRSLSVVALAASATFLAACTSSVTISSASTPPSSGASIAPSSSGASTCDLITSSDVQTAIGESVTATRPLSGATAGSAAQIQECVLTTDGPPLAGTSAATLNALANGLMGGTGASVDLTTGGIAIIEASTSFALTASPDASALPSGVTAVPGVGQQAYVTATPAGGGLAFAQLTPSKAILVLDMEGKQVTDDQLTALLKAAASHA